MGAGSASCVVSVPAASAVGSDAVNSGTALSCAAEVSWASSVASASWTCSGVTWKYGHQCCRVCDNINIQLSVSYLCCRLPAHHLEHEARNRKPVVVSTPTCAKTLSRLCSTFDVCLKHSRPIAHRACLLHTHNCCAAEYIFSPCCSTHSNSSKLCCCQKLEPRHPTFSTH